MFLLVLRQLSFTIETNANGVMPAQKPLLNITRSSKLVDEFWDSLETLSSLHNASLFCVLVYSVFRLKGNAEADLLAKTGSNTSFCCAQPIVGVRNIVRISLVRRNVRKAHFFKGANLWEGYHTKLFVPTNNYGLLQKQKSSLQTVTCCRGKLTSFFEWPAVTAECLHRALT